MLLPFCKSFKKGKNSEKLQRVNNYISISVLDDGRGFITSENKTFGKNHGFGLMSIKETLEHFGGKIEIDTRLGRGSKITIFAPLKDNNNDYSEAFVK